MIEVVPLHKVHRREYRWTPELHALNNRLFARICVALDRLHLLDHRTMELASGGLLPRFAYLPQFDSFALMNEDGDGFAPTRSLLGYATVEEAVARWVADHPNVRDVHITADATRDFRQYRAAELRASDRGGRLLHP